MSNGCFLKPSQGHFFHQLQYDVGSIMQLADDQSNTYCKHSCHICHIVLSNEMLSPLNAFTHSTHVDLIITKKYNKTNLKSSISKNEMGGG